jgi:hypothetical protein
MTSQESAAQSAKNEALAEKLKEMRRETEAMETAQNKMGAESGTESSQMQTEDNEGKPDTKEEDQEKGMQTEENEEKPDTKEEDKKWKIGLKSMSAEEKKNMEKNTTNRLQKELDEMHKNLPEHLKIFLESVMMKRALEMMESYKKEVALILQNPSKDPTRFFYTATGPGGELRLVDYTTKNKDYPSMGYGYICMEELLAADRRDWVDLNQVRASMKILQETREALEKTEKSVKKRRLHESVHTHKQRAKTMLQAAQDLLKRSLDMEAQAALLQPTEEEKEDEEGKTADDMEEEDLSLKRKAEQSENNMAERAAAAAQATQEGSEELRIALDMEDQEKVQELIEEQIGKNEATKTREKPQIPAYQTPAMLMPPPRLQRSLGPRRAISAHLEKRYEQMAKKEEKKKDQEQNKKEQLEGQKMEAEMLILQERMHKLRMAMSGTGTEISESMEQDKEEAAQKVRQGEMAVKIKEEEPEKESGNPFKQKPAGGWKAEAPPPLGRATGSWKPGDAFPSGGPGNPTGHLGYQQEPTDLKPEEKLPILKERQEPMEEVD